MAALQTELGHFQDARQSYERFAELSPLMEKFYRDWLTGAVPIPPIIAVIVRRICNMRQVPGPFYEAIARRLAEAPPEAKRVVLPVGFVRQHHLTCARATLAMISRFWSMPCDHLEVAAAICYDGTPAHSERHWAETHGWVAREFTVTWDSAVALLTVAFPSR